MLIAQGSGFPLEKKGVQIHTHVPLISVSGV